MIKENQKKNSVGRLWEIDMLRGITVIGMIIFHIFFVLDFFGVEKTNMHRGWPLALGILVRFSFIGLVGVSLALSRNKSLRRQLLRGLQILGLGLLITLVTLFVMPEKFVYFGILHMIGVGIIVAAPLKNKKYLSLLLAIVFLFVWIFISQKTGHGLASYILGFKSTEFQSLDYFPILKWIGLIFAGVFFGNIYRSHRLSVPSKSATIVSPIIFLGRHALAVYMVHVPVIALVVLLVRKFVL